MSKNRMDFEIRWMIRRDMPEVLAIENSCFEFPWTENDFVKELRQRNVIGMVVEYKKQIVGFMLYELNKDHLRILDFAVAIDFRRRGIGRQMIGKLISKLSHLRRLKIVANLRESNLLALEFFKAMGFECVRLILQPFTDSTDDAYQMEYRIGKVARKFSITNRIAR